MKPFHFIPLKYQDFWGIGSWIWKLKQAFLKAIRTFGSNVAFQKVCWFLYKISVRLYFVIMAVMYYLLHVSPCAFRYVKGRSMGGGIGSSFFGHRPKEDTSDPRWSEGWFLRYEIPKNPLNNQFPVEWNASQMSKPFFI